MAKSKQEESKLKVILRKKLSIEQGVLNISLSDSIDTMAYKGSMTLVKEKAIEDCQIGKGDSITILDKLYDTEKVAPIFNGIVWTKKTNFKPGTISLDIRERTINMSNSEDEYLFKEGTASERIKQIAGDWGIPLGSIPDTKIKLKKGVKKGKLLDMMREFLKETSKNGGKMYILRMEDKLNMYELGKNKIIYDLETLAEDCTFTNSLEGAVTHVKVLGESKDDKKKTPVLAEDSRWEDKFGKLQKIVQDEKVKKKNEAKTFAKTHLSWGDVNFNIKGAIDINTIRSGDKVRWYGKEYIVCDVTHNINPHATMSITACVTENVRRKYFE